MLNEDQFWASVDVREDEECWEWQGGKYTGGYGYVGWNGIQAKTHRLAWELINGPIPEGLWVLHTCDNPPCCNPSHLFLGTCKDNLQDAMNKGRLNNEEHRSKISKANKGNTHMLGKHHSVETKEKISKAGKGKIPWNVGKHPSEEARRKMCEAQKRRQARKREARGGCYNR